jgi:uncharacterized protein (TIGR02145 family)
MNRKLLYLIVLFFLALLYACDEPEAENQDPTISFSAPSNNSTFVKGETIIFSVTVEDPENDLREVRFYANNIGIGSDQSWPYEYSWETSSLDVGEYTIKAEVIDNAGAKSDATIRVNVRVQNDLSGIVSNSGGDVLEGAEVTLSTTNIAKNGYVETDGRSTVSGRIEKQPGMEYPGSYSESTFIGPKSLPKLSSLYSTLTDQDGYYEFIDIEAGNYLLEVSFSGYDASETTINELSGSQTQNVTLQASLLGQVSSIYMQDGNYNIRVYWSELDDPALAGYNLYERHWFLFEQSFWEDATYIHPNYTAWDQVNSTLIIDNEYTVNVEEYNSKYGFYVVPVNVDGLEAEYIDETDEVYSSIDYNISTQSSFGLTADAGMVSIPDNNNWEVALHMGYYYTDALQLFSLDEWIVEASYNGSNWFALGQAATPEGSVHASNYGETVTFDLSSYRGQTLHLRTDPTVFDSGTPLLITNLVNVYMQDGSSFDSNTPPTAAFTVTPTVGDAETVFTFDASSSSDNEDATSELEVRWDWENDGTWDTNYSTDKSATHQYSSNGSYTIELDVRDSGGLSRNTSQQVAVAAANTPPSASFTVSPPSGDTQTVFTLSASESTDMEDETSQLEVRWDWENDGTWDTNYSTVKSITHQFGFEGAKAVALEVRDSEDLMDEHIVDVRVLPDENVDIITDIDGNEYQVVRIGDQWWMMQDLKVTQYRNGDDIPLLVDNSNWSSTIIGAHCFFENDANYTIWQRAFYNWFAVSDPRGLGPEGWHVPSEAEWDELKDYITMDAGPLKEAGTEHWFEPNNATNETGFTSLPSGHRGGYSGGYFGLGTTSSYWLSNEFDSTRGYYEHMYYNTNTLYGMDIIMMNKNMGYSVRCIKD